MSASDATEAHRTPVETDAAERNTSMPAPEANILPPPTAPLDVALVFFKKRYWCEDADTHRLVYWRDDFYAWNGSNWVKLADGDIRAEFYMFAGRAFYHKPDGEPVPWAPNRHRVNNVMDALEAACRVGDELQPPCWLDGSPYGCTISLRNGLLDITAGGERTLRPHTPMFFNLTSLPYGYDDDARCPGWDAFMRQLFCPGDGGEPDNEPAYALEQFLGCIVARKTDLQRILVLIGPPRSGKGTIFKVIENLVGLAHAVSTQLLKLTEDNTLSSLIGKSVCLIPDMRATTGKMPQIAETLLSISGQDSFTIDRKYKPAWTGVLNTLLATASNEFPGLRDASGALSSRYVPIIMTESFLGREDRTLLPRLLSELPGILNRALDGLDYVLANGRFTEPKVSVEAIEDLAELASPMKRFVAEHLAVMPKGGDPGEYTTPIIDLFETYKVWAHENGEPPICRETFGQRLRSALPRVKRSQPRGDGGARISSYAGVRLLRRETASARAKRHALEEMEQRTAGGVRVIKGGGDVNDA
jgi:putative DNA primase/helicase